MNNRRSYLDSMNVGRRRRASTSLEQLNDTLDELESRIGGPRDDGYRLRHRDHRPRDESSYHDSPAERDRRAPARDLRAERYRRPPAREDAAAALPGELRALREELRQQMSAGLRREFAALKGEIERATRTPAPAAEAAALGEEFERLSGMIHKLAHRSDDRQVELLRREMAEVKHTLGKLAREDTVQSFDRRWSELDQRWNDIASRLASAPNHGAADAAIHTLGARLEQIGDAVDALPTSVTLRSLEEKMKLLAASVEQFAHQRDRLGPEAIDAIGERLDEISRAVVASSAAAHPASFDPEPFERIEARISSLARQIAEITEESQAGGLADQLATLSRRVEDIAYRVDLPDQAVERLAGQIDFISRKLEDGPALPNLDQAFHGIESRFASLSDMLEQRHEDALTQGQALFRDLERRLEEVTARMEGGREQPHAHEAQLIEAMDARFSELAARIERQAAAPTDSGAMRDLEARLESISSRIEASALRPGVDPELISSLESQVAGLAAHIANPATQAAEADDIRPRLDNIERSIVESRRDVLEAARQAAEEAVRSLSGAQGEGPLVAALVDDLKSLEALNRRADDRNAKTFEAIHDTLLKIVDRLGTVEAGVQTRRGGADTARDTLGPAQTPTLEPSIEAIGEDEDAAREPARHVSADGRTPAAAAAEAAAEAMRDAESGAAEAGGGRRSMLSGLARALTGRKTGQGGGAARPRGEPAFACAAAADAPTVDVDAPLDPRTANQPLEPGSGAPDLNAIMKRVRSERDQPARGPDAETAKSDFIAAARRAAQAAAAEAEMMKRGPAAKARSGGLGIGDLLKNRRKPLLMGVAAVLIVLAAFQFGRPFLAGGGGDSARAPAPILAEATAPEPAAPEAFLMEEEPSGVRMAGESETLPLAEGPLADEPSISGETPLVEDEELASAWLDTGTVTALPPEELVEIETVAEPSEELLAAIPPEAGPAALREAAAAGDPKALYEIGHRYADGRGVGEDMARAAEWYEMAAGQGLAPAQYRIGNLYEKGIGVERDIASAKTWYQLAATQGNASAMHNLAVLYAMGADGPADNETAARWFTEAAELGVKDSQFNLGILSAKGVGMPQNLEEAYKWFALVAKAGDKDAGEKRDEIANALRPDQLERARAAAELWRAKAIDPEANTVELPESWSEGADVTAGIDMRQAVRNIQHILNNNGYDAGAEDGIMGQRTTTAIAAFQSDNGMTPTGEIDEPLVRALLDRR